MKRIAFVLLVLVTACTPAALPPQQTHSQQHHVRPMDGGGPIGGRSTPAQVAPTPTPAPTVAPMDGGGPIGG